MDSLTFGSTILLRHLTFSEARKMPIKEITLSKVLDELKMTMAEVRNANSKYSSLSIFAYYLDAIIAILFEELDLFEH